MRKEDFKKLWIRDKGWTLRRPSIDRKDTKGHYEYSNCSFIEMEDNYNRNAKPVTQYSMNGVFLMQYNSIGEAARAMDVHFTSIMRAVQNKSGKRTSCGYKWKFSKTILGTEVGSSGKEKK